MFLEAFITAALLCSLNISRANGISTRQLLGIKNKAQSTTTACSAKFSAFKEYFSVEFQKTQHRAFMSVNITDVSSFLSDFRKSNCMGTRSLYWSINEPGDLPVTTGVGAACKAVGGHYDPTAMCGPYSDNETCKNQAPSKDLPQDLRALGYMCDPLVNYAFNGGCEEGDMAGKYGGIPILSLMSSKESKVNILLDITDSQDTVDTCQLEGKVIVISCPSSDEPLFCGKIDVSTDTNEEFKQHLKKHRETTLKANLVTIRQ